MRAAWILPCLSLLLAAQEPLALNAPIRRVRLHPDEAWITRVGQARIGSAGTHRLQIQGLPSGLGLEDVRVSAKGPQGTRLGDLSLRSEVRKVTETHEFQALKKEQESLRDRQDALEAEGEALAQEVIFLKGLQATYDKEVSVRLGSNLPGPGPVVELSKGLQDRLAEVLTRDRKRRREQQRLAGEAQRLDLEIRRREVERTVSPSHATVELALAHPGNVEIELTYRSHRAGWTAAYEARLNADGRALELALFAEVRQRSGEDWSGVQLEVTNARASRSLTLAQFDGPQIVTWSEFAPMKRESGHPAQAAVVEVVATQNAYVAERLEALPTTIIPDADAGSAPQVEETQGIATTWAMEGAKEVPSDGEPHRFRVLTREVNPQMTLVATPRLDPTIYRVARFQVPQGIPLFPGAKVVHFAGTQRIGTAQIELPAPGQPMQMGFGPFRGLRVALKRLEAKREQVGAFTKETQWTLRERFELSNDLDEPAQVEVQDRELRTGNDKVRMTPLPETTPSKEGAVPGVRVWTLTVPAKGTSGVALGQQIRVPLGGAVTGLGSLNLPE